MAAPVFLDDDIGETDAGGAWAPTAFGVTGGTTNTICILQVLQDGATSGALTDVAFTNINALDGTANSADYLGAFPVGGSSQALQHLWIGRKGAGNPDVSGNNSTSEDLYIRWYAFNNVRTAAGGGVSVATVIENSTAGATANGAATNGTIADTAVTTLGPDRLALNFVAINDDNVIDAFTGETGGDWTLAVSPYAESSGTDGAIGLQYGYVWDVGVYYAPTGSDAIVYGSGGVNEEQAQSFASGAGGTVTSVSLALQKNSSPTDNLIVEIQTNNAGVPSGTVVGTSGSLSAASLPASPRWFSIPVSATLAASTTYHLVVRRDGSRDTTNFCSVYKPHPTDSVYADGTASSRNSGTWSNNAFDIGFGISYGAGTINGGTATNSDATDGWGVVGFALIGTTVAAAYVPRHPAHDFGSVTNF